MSEQTCEHCHHWKPDTCVLGKCTMILRMMPPDEPRAANPKQMFVYDSETGGHQTTIVTGYQFGCSLFSPKIDIEKEYV